jgi:hypothetical protein
MYDLEVWQNGMMVAGASGDDFERVHAEAMHYAFIYGQDGPTEIRGIPIDKYDWLLEQLKGSPVHSS